MTYPPPPAVPQSAAPSRRRIMPVILAVAITAAVCGLGGMAIGSAGNSGTPAAAKTVAPPAPAASTVTVTKAVEAPKPPPTTGPPPPPPAPTISNGTWTVGTDFPAGTYRTVGAPGDCYWKIAVSGSNGSDIVNNHIGGGNLTVTLKQGQDFQSEGCGTWTKTG